MAAIHVLVDFVTTTDARPFKVRFVDPATNKAILIDLGAVGCTVQGGTGRPLPVTGGCSDVPKRKPYARLTPGVKSNARCRGARIHRGQR